MKSTTCQSQVGRSNSNPLGQFLEFWITGDSDGPKSKSAEDLEGPEGRKEPDRAGDDPQTGLIASNVSVLVHVTVLFVFFFPALLDILHLLHFMF